MAVMKLPPILAAIIILPSATSFAPAIRQKTTPNLGSSSRSGSISSSISSSSALSYATDDDAVDSESIDLAASLARHASPPPPPQEPLPSPFSALLENTDDDWKEWQYSFSRNGLTDFLPQFSSHISCLAIDVTNAAGRGPAAAISDAISKSARLPWQHGNEDDVDSRATTSITKVSLNDPLGRVTMNATASIAEVGEEDGYDCILDGGVMNGIVSSLPPTVTWHSRTGPPALLDLVRLVHEATLAIGEFGIYVAVTDASIPDHARGYLDAMGEAMGLEWNYDLDGLSREGRSVSVARKHFAGPVNFSPSSSGDDARDDDKNILRP